MPAGSLRPRGLASDASGYSARRVPELPDVEGFRRYFNRFAAGRRVARVEVPDESMLRNATRQGVGRALRGTVLAAAQRRGKWLLVPAAGSTLLLHFGMTGSLHWWSDGSPPHRHDRLVLHFDAGALAYRNMRKFGGVWLARAGLEPEAITGPLGVDAAAITSGQLAGLAGQRRGGVKALLMDQRVVAGSGNLLTDESLWRARIHPRRAAASLSDAEVRRLHAALHEVIRDSSRHGRIPRKDGWLTGVRDDRGARCPRCGRRLSRGTVAGRTTVWCPHCQRKR